MRRLQIFRLVSEASFLASVKGLNVELFLPKRLIFIKRDASPLKTVFQDTAGLKKSNFLLDVLLYVVVQVHNPGTLSSRRYL